MSTITLDFTNNTATYTSPTKTVEVKVNNANHKDKMIERAKANAEKAGMFFKITGQLPNHYLLTDDIASDACPVHDTPVRRIYDFGYHGDAEVITYSGCSCAVCIKHEDLLSDATYHTNYQDAASRAEYIKQSFNVHYRM
jgi:hypothetical protein